jgi:hypothetical protein
VVSGLESIGAPNPRCENYIIAFIPRAILRNSVLGRKVPVHGILVSLCVETHSPERITQAIASSIFRCGRVTHRLKKEVLEGELLKWPTRRFLLRIDQLQFLAK